jgi:hypothetical protein
MPGRCLFLGPSCKPADIPQGALTIICAAPGPTCRGWVEGQLPCHGDLGGGGGKTRVDYAMNGDCRGRICRTASAKTCKLLRARNCAPGVFLLPPGLLTAKILTVFSFLTLFSSVSLPFARSPGPAVENREILSLQSRSSKDRAAQPSPCVYVRACQGSRARTGQGK